MKSSSVLCGFLAAIVLAGPGPPAGGSTLFGLIDTGEIFVSTDHGSSWKVQAALPVHDAVGLRAGRSTSELRLLSRSGGVWSSTDGGFNWTAVGSVPASDCVEMAYRADGRLLVLTATGTFWLSPDGGGSFSVLAACPAANFVSLAARGDGDLFAVTRTGEIESSPDLGVTWSVVGAIPVPDVVACRASGSMLFLLTSTGSAWRSLDDGRSWSAVGSTGQVGTRGFTVDDGVLTAATREGHIFRSADGGSWSAVGSINQVHLAALADDRPGVSGVPEPTRPIAIDLLPPWPNPWRAGSGPICFSFALDREGLVRLEIFDAAGRRVDGVPPRWFAATGAVQNEIRWSPGSLAAGSYLARLAGSGGRGGNVTLVIVR